MNIEIRYHSRGGNTKKLAEAISSALKVEAKSCSTPINEPVDILFLGGSVYGFGLDDATKKFIAGLDSKDVKDVALFGTSAISKSGNKEMTKLLKEKGISVLEPSFYCRGEFTLMHKGHPNEEDLKKVKDFALNICEKN